jgi:hypothetical protein
MANLGPPHRDGQSDSVVDQYGGQLEQQKPDRQIRLAFQFPLEKMGNQPRLESFDSDRQKALRQAVKHPRRCGIARAEMQIQSQTLESEYANDFFKKRPAVVDPFSQSVDVNPQHFLFYPRRMCFRSRFEFGGFEPFSYRKFDPSIEENHPETGF